MPECTLFVLPGWSLSESLGFGWNFVGKSPPASFCSHSNGMAKRVNCKKLFGMDIIKIEEWFIWHISLL
jgi:hypothetical protein